MKLAIIGNYGATNIGDEAILDSILSHHPSYKWVVFGANPQQKYERAFQAAHLFPLGFRSFFKHGWIHSFKALKGVDAVIIGGGGLMQDDTLYACFLWAWQVFWVKLLGKPYFIYATGVGPLKTFLGRILTRFVYRGAAGVTVRDLQSYHTLQKLKLPTDNLEVTADPVALSRVRLPDSIDSRAPHTYLISLRPWLNDNQKIVDAFTRFLSKLKEEKRATIIFVAMQKVKEKDHLVIDPIIDRVGGELFVPQNYTELIHRMQQCEFAIGMRYHFLMAAMLTGTPALGVSYAHKVDSLFKGSNLEPYYLPISSLSAQQLSEKMKRLSVDYNNVKIYQKQAIEKMRASAQKNIGFLEGFTKILTTGE